MIERTGVAQIIVEDSGQNMIVIVSGANDFLSPEDVENAKETLSKAKIMVSVLEIPRQTVLAGLKLATQLGGEPHGRASQRLLFFLNKSLSYSSSYRAKRCTSCGRSGTGILRPVGHFLRKRNGSKQSHLKLNVFL